MVNSVWSHAHTRAHTHTRTHSFPFPPFPRSKPCETGEQPHGGEREREKKKIKVHQIRLNQMLRCFHQEGGGNPGGPAPRSTEYLWYVCSDEAGGISPARPGVTPDERQLLW